jgi:hypothetical protein
MLKQVYAHFVRPFEEVKQDSSLDCREFPNAFFWCYFAYVIALDIHLLQMQIVQQLSELI